MNRYFFNGREVSRNRAVYIWHESKTYRMANRRIRGYIFINADKGKTDGGEEAHLAEAGITIQREKASAVD